MVFSTSSTCHGRHRSPQNVCRANSCVAIPAISRRRLSICRLSPNLILRLAGWSAIFMMGTIVKSPPTFLTASGGRHFTGRMIIDITPGNNTTRHSLPVKHTAGCSPSGTKGNNINGLVIAFRSVGHRVAANSTIVNRINLRRRRWLLARRFHEWSVSATRGTVEPLELPSNTTACATNSRRCHRHWFEHPDLYDDRRSALHLPGDPHGIKPRQSGSADATKLVAELHRRIRRSAGQSQEKCSRPPAIGLQPPVVIDGLVTAVAKRAGVSSIIAAGSSSRDQLDSNAFLQTAIINHHEPTSRRTPVAHRLASMRSVNGSTIRRTMDRRRFADEPADGTESGSSRMPPDDRPCQ